MSYAEDNNHDIPFDMLEYMSSEDTDWNTVWDIDGREYIIDTLPETLWECKDGTILAIEDMKTSHIKNCIAMIERSIKANKPWRTWYLEPLTQELKRRQQ